MGNYLNLGKYADEARALLDAIKGGAIRQMELQFEALKKQFTDKLSSVNVELRAFVNSEKGNVQSIFSNPDLRYSRLDNLTFNVGGDFNKFYPVFIPCSNGTLNRLSIFRENVGDDIGAVSGLESAANIGTTCIDITALCGRWGHAVPVTIINSHHHYLTQFVGKVINDARMPGIIVYLRGGNLSYHIRHDDVSLTSCTTYTDDQPGLSSSINDMSVFLSGLVDSTKGYLYRSIEIADISLKTNYVRGG